MFSFLFFYQRRNLLIQADSFVIGEFLVDMHMTAQPYTKVSSFPNSLQIIGQMIRFIQPAAAVNFLHEGSVWAMGGNDAHPVPNFLQVF